MGACLSVPAEVREERKHAKKGKEGPFGPQGEETPVQVQPVSGASSSPGTQAGTSSAECAAPLKERPLEDSGVRADAGEGAPRAEPSQANVPKPLSGPSGSELAQVQDRLAPQGQSSLSPLHQQGHPLGVEGNRGGPPPSDWSGDLASASASEGRAEQLRSGKDTEGPSGDHPAHPAYGGNHVESAIASAVEDFFTDITVALVEGEGGQHPPLLRGDGQRILCMVEGPLATVEEVPELGERGEEDTAAAHRLLQEEAVTIEERASASGSRVDAVSSKTGVSSSQPVTLGAAVGADPAAAKEQMEETVSDKESSSSSGAHLATLPPTPSPATGADLARAPRRAVVRLPSPLLPPPVPPASAPPLKPGLQSGALESQWGSVGEKGVAEAMGEVLVTEVGQEMEGVRRAAAAARMEDLQHKGEGEGEGEGAPAAFSAEDVALAAALAPELAAKAGALSDAALSHGASLRELAARGRAMRPSMVGGAVELARGCVEFMRELRRGDSLPPWLVDSSVRLGVAALAEQAASHGLNACVWERTKRVLTEGCELTLAAERMHDLAHLLVRGFEALLPSSSPFQKEGGTGMPGQGGHQWNFTVTAALKLAELASGHIRGMHANMLKRQYMDASIEQQQLAADLLEYGPRTIHFFSSHFRLAQDTANLAAAALALTGCSAPGPLEPDSFSRGQSSDLSERRGSRSRRDPEGLPRDQDVALLLDAQGRTQRHADRICETGGDVDGAILMEGADLAVALADWAAQLVAAQEGRQPSGASALVSGAASLCQHSCAQYASLADRFVKGMMVSTAAASEASCISALASAYVRLLGLAVGNTPGSGGAGKGSAAGLVMDPSALPAYSKLSSATAAVAQKLSAAASASESRAPAPQTEGSPPEEPRAPLTAMVTESLLADAASLVLLACSSVKLALSSKPAGETGGSALRQGQGGPPRGIVSSRTMTASSGPGGGMGQTPGPSVLDDASGLVEQGRLYVGMLEQGLGLAPGARPGLGGQVAEEDSARSSLRADRRDQGTERRAVWDAKVVKEGLRVSVLASAHARLLQEKSHHLSSLGNSAACSATCRAAELAKHASLHSRRLLGRWAEDEGSLDRRALEDADELLALLEGHLALLQRSAHETESVIHMPFHVAVRAGHVAEEAALLLQALVHKHQQEQQQAPQAQQRSQRFRQQGQLLRQKQQRGILLLVAPLARVIAAGSLHTQDLELLTSTARSLVGWDVATVLEDAGKLALLLAQRAGQEEGLGDQALADSAAILCRSLQYMRTAHALVRSPPATEAEMVLAAEELRDTARAAAGAIQSSHERGAPVEGELTAHVSALQSQLAAHGMALKQVESCVGPALLGSATQLLSEVAALLQNLEARRADRRKVERADLSSAQRLAARLAAHKRSMESQAWQAQASLASGAAGMAGQAARQVQLLAVRASQKAESDEEVEAGSSLLVNLLSTHVAAMERPVAPSPSASPFPSSLLAVCPKTAARCSHMAALAQSLSQELWDRASSGEAVDKPLLGLGVALLSSSAHHSAVLQLQASTCGHADPTSVAEARELSACVSAHLRGLADKKAEGQGLDAGTMAEAVRVTLLAIAHARRLQFQESSAGPSTVAEALGLAKQLGGHVQMVVVKAAKRATADASLVSSLEGYSALAESHTHALLALTRPSSTPDASVALSSAMLSTSAAFHSALLHFSVAGALRTSPLLASSASGLQAQASSLRVAMAARMEGREALEEDTASRLEDIEGQTRTQEERTREAARSGSAVQLLSAAEAARVAAKAASLCMRTVSRVSPAAGLPASLLQRLQSVAEQLLSQAELLKSMARNNAQLDVSTAMAALEAARLAYQAVQQLRGYLERIEGGRTSPLAPEVVLEGLQLAEITAKLGTDVTRLVAPTLQAQTGSPSPELKGLTLNQIAEVARMVMRTAQHARLLDSKKAVTPDSGSPASAKKGGTGQPSTSTDGRSSGVSSLAGTSRTTHKGPSIFSAVEDSIGSAAVSSSIQPPDLPPGPSFPSLPSLPRSAGAFIGGEAPPAPTLSPANAALACSSSRLLLAAARGLEGAVGSGEEPETEDQQQQDAKRRGSILLSRLSTLICELGEHAQLLVARGPPCGAVPLSVTAQCLSVAAQAAEHAGSLSSLAAAEARLDAPSVAAAVNIAASAVRLSEAIQAAPMALLVSAAAASATDTLVEWACQHASTLSGHASLGTVAVHAPMVASAAGAAARAAATAVLLAVPGEAGQGGGAARGASGASARPELLASSGSLLLAAESQVLLVEREMEGRGVVGQELAQQAASLAHAAFTHSRVSFSQSSTLGLPAAAEAASLAFYASSHAAMVLGRLLAPVLPRLVSADRGTRQQPQHKLQQTVSLAVLKSAEALAASVKAHSARLEKALGGEGVGASGTAQEHDGKQQDSLSGTAEPGNAQGSDRGQERSSSEDALLAGSSDLVCFAVAHAMAVEAKCAGGETVDESLVADLVGWTDLATSHLHALSRWLPSSGLEAPKTSTSGTSQLARRIASHAQAMRRRQEVSARVDTALVAAALRLAADCAAHAHSMQSDLDAIHGNESRAPEDVAVDAILQHAKGVEGVATMGVSSLKDGLLILAPVIKGHESAIYARQKR